MQGKLKLCQRKLTKIFHIFNVCVVFGSDFDI